MKLIVDSEARVDETACRSRIGQRRNFLSFGYFFEIESGRRVEGRGIEFKFLILVASLSYVSNADSIESLL